MFDDPRDPCPAHPGWERFECWRCGRAERPQAPHVRGITLSKSEQDSFETLTGVRPEDRNHMDRVMVEKDLRFIDKGDKQDRRRRELAEWRRDTRGRSNTTPVPTGRGNPYDFSKGTYTLKDAWKETGEKSS